MPTGRSGSFPASSHLGTCCFRFTSTGRFTLNQRRDRLCRWCLVYVPKKYAIVRIAKAGYGGQVHRTHWRADSSADTEGNVMHPIQAMVRCSCIVLLLVTIFPTASQAQEFNTSRGKAGADYRGFSLSQPNYQICEQACNDDSKCQAWTYVNPGNYGVNAHCWLLKEVPPKTANNCCTSGVKQHARQNSGYMARWRAISPGVSWQSEWTYYPPEVGESHGRKVCGHGNNCGCNGQNFCGYVGAGETVTWWPHGCAAESWQLVCDIQ